MLKYTTIALLLTGCLAAQTVTHTEPPPRKVEGNTITSTSDPAARIQLLDRPVYVAQSDDLTVLICDYASVPAV